MTEHHAAPPPPEPEPTPGQYSNHYYYPAQAPETAKTKWLEPTAIIVGAATVALVVVGFNVNNVLQRQIDNLSLDVTNLDTKASSRFDSLESDIRILTGTVRTLAETVASNTGEEGTARLKESEARLELKSQLMSAFSQSNSILVSKLDAIETSNYNTGIVLANFEAEQHKLKTDIGNARTHINHLESNLGQEVSTVVGNVTAVTEELERVTNDVNDVGNTVAAINGSVDATVVVTSTVGDNKDKIEALESDSSDTEQKIIQYKAMLDNGIQNKDVTRVVNKLFEENVKLQTNPALLSTILAEKKQFSPGRFRKNLSDTHSLIISDENSLILAYDVLAVPQDKSLYKEPLPDASADTEPELAAALQGTPGETDEIPDDTLPGNLARVEPNEPTTIDTPESTDVTTAGSGKVSIIDACSVLIVGEEPRDSCYLHFLDLLTKKHPELNHAGADFSDSEIEEIRAIHSTDIGL